MDDYDKLFAKQITGVVLAVVLALYFTGYAIVGLTVGQRYQTTGYVRMYEQSSWIDPHTWIVLETYGGTEASLTLFGYHDFELGEAYTIKTVCRRGGFLDLANWHEVIDIHLHEEVKR